MTFALPISDGRIRTNLRQSLTAEVSGAGEPPPCALTDTDVNLSAHPAPIIQPSVFPNDFAFFTGSSHKMVDQTVRPDDPTPSLHPHYRDLNTTASWSAPVSRIGTLTLVGPPLGFLPYHRNDRFPRSTQEPGSGSRHLYAGRRPGSKQVSPGLILEWCTPPVSTSSFCFRHLISGSLALVSLNLT